MFVVKLLGDQNGNANKDYKSPDVIDTHSDSRLETANDNNIDDTKIDADKAVRIPATPHVGDVVVVEEGIGIVRYVGKLYYGIEITKRNSCVKLNGNNGTYGYKEYFKTTQPGTGIFRKSIIRFVFFLYLYNWYLAC